jgi:HTH-type transcriptional regulator, sugar sensing transcriptional regulator
MSGAALVAALEALGFTLNEARAYAALLSRGASTGYEIGQAASVPRSAVYGVLRRLVDQGAARSIPARDGAPERFVGVPVDTLISLLRKRFETQTKGLEDLARDLAAPPSAPEAFTVRTYARILEEADRLVTSAKRKLLVSGWPREITLLAAALDKAHKRKVMIVLFSHAAIPSTIPGEIFSYELSEPDVESFWKHRLCLVADDARTLVGAVEQSDRARHHAAHPTTQTRRLRVHGPHARRSRGSARCVDGAVEEAPIVIAIRTARIAATASRAPNLRSGTKLRPLRVRSRHRR